MILNKEKYYGKMNGLNHPSSIMCRNESLNPMKVGVINMRFQK